MSTQQNMPAAAPAMTLEQAMAQIAQLQAQVALNNAPKAGLGLKISAKGALSLYGLGRFPVTLYKSQWAKLLAHSEQIQAFIKANDALLKSND